jgi:Flp pilus assembly protein TadD
LSIKINIKNLKLHKTPSKEQLDNLLKHYQSGDYKNTKKLALSLTQNFPHHPLGWKALSVALKKTGKISESLKANQKIVEITPKDSVAHYNLGNTYKDLAKFEKAEVSYKQAITLKSNFAEANYNLGIVLKELDKFEEAEKHYKQAIKLKPNFADAYNNLGTIFERLGKLEEAEKHYKQAIKLKPNFADAYNNLGTILEQLGKLKEAEKKYEKAILINPGLTNAHRQLALIKKFDKYDEQYSILQNIYLNKNVSEEQRCHINFSLAKIHDDLGNFKEAFKHYTEGNIIQKKKKNYNIKEDIKLFNQIKLSYSQITKKTLQIKNYRNDIIPIFILGMPRSGTTLVEQIISSHSEVIGLGELPFVSQFGQLLATGLSEINTETLLNFRESYLKKLQGLSKEKKIVTDKMPQNFFYIGLLVAAFPEAKILHVKRNSAAVCWANYRQWFRSRNLDYSYSIDDIIKYFKLYEDLMIFWHKSIKNIIYDIDYEMLTIDQNNITKKLIKHLGLNWEERCLSPEDNQRSVSTASNIQIRKKIFKGSSQKWKEYKPFLNGLLDNLDY